MVLWERSKEIVHELSDDDLLQGYDQIRKSSELRSKMLRDIYRNEVRRRKLKDVS